ncbi:hypothetical protein MARI151_30363 [Maribacter litoralis]|uniref:Uncharacterized protein n=1 Tax=Maribacter litoralis TaxID=2059726 RepID=A0A653SRF5_9FLAO|nr:hypothetical protein MARI151_30363 [Maribacter litoralis]
MIKITIHQFTPFNITEKTSKETPIKHMKITSCCGNVVVKYKNVEETKG